MSMIPVPQVPYCLYLLMLIWPFLLSNYNIQNDTITIAFYHNALSSLHLSSFTKFQTYNAVSKFSLTWQMHVIIQIRDYYYKTEQVAPGTPGL